MCLSLRKPRPRILARRERGHEDAKQLRAWATAVKARAGNRCEVCGRAGFMDAAHIISRRYRATRYALDNGACLCRRCHEDYDHHVTRIWREPSGLKWERLAE